MKYNEILLTSGVFLIALGMTKYFLGNKPMSPVELIFCGLINLIAAFMIRAFVNWRSKKKEDLK